MRKILLITALALTILMWGCTKQKKVIPPEDNQVTPAPTVISPTSTPAPSPAVTTTPQPTKAPTASTSKPSAANTQSGNDKIVRAVATSANVSLYSVKVDISEQMVYIYKSGELFKKIICSTGIPGSKDTETPLGSYKINGYSGLSFYSQQYKEGARYWVGFIGSEFLFHSVPIDQKGNIIQEEAAKLGQPASHGCIRMSMDDSKWFYETIPTGTNVTIEQ